MRIKRLLPVLFGFLIFVASLALIVQLRKHAPPEPARLLPGADAFVYADFAWARRANGGKLAFPGSQSLGSQSLGSQNAGSQGTVAHDPEYERFIQETGFDFERDLDA